MILFIGTPKMVPLILGNPKGRLKEPAHGHFAGDPASQVLCSSVSIYAHVSSACMLILDTLNCHHFGVS